MWFNYHCILDDVFVIVPWMLLLTFQVEMYRYSQISNNILPADKTIPFTILVIIIIGNTLLTHLLILMFVNLLSFSHWMITNYTQWHCSDHPVTVLWCSNGFIGIESDYNCIHLCTYFDELANHLHMHLSIFYDLRFSRSYPKIIWTCSIAI